MVSKRKLVREKSKAWIKESPEDEPVNFMDPMVVKSVVGKCVRTHILCITLQSSPPSSPSL